MSTNRKNIAILFSTLVVVMLGFGVIIPILPFYIKSFGASGRALGLLMATHATMQFICAPIWGILSDRYGRKPILIVGVVGNALAHLLFGLSTELWMLFAARALAGILSSATMPTAMAYVADTTSEEDRGGGMGAMSAAIGVGVILGPGFGGWLGTISLSLPFFVAAALSACALLPIIMILPESLPPDARTRRPLGESTRLLKAMCQALLGPIAFLLVLSFLLDLGFSAFEGVFGLFALECYGYGPERVGTILVMFGVIFTIMQGILAGPLIRRFGEVFLIKVSLAACGVSFLLMLQAVNFIGVMLTVGFYAISNALLRPSVSSLISKRAASGQGEAMGLNNSFMSLGRIIGPAGAGFLFDININLPYICGSFVMFTGFFSGLFWLRRNK